MTTFDRRQKAYLRGAIWVALLIGLVLLPSFNGDKADAQPIKVSSR